MRQPLARGLVLSFSIHLALLALLQPRPGHDAPRTWVINARILSPELKPEAMKPDEAPVAPDEMEPPPPTQRNTDPVESASEPSSLAIPKPSNLQMMEPATLPAKPTEDAHATGTPSRTSGAEAKPTPPTPPANQAPGIPSPFDPTWYLTRQVDRPPKAIGTITPAYPELARQRSLEGSVKLMVRIDDLGRVQEVEVVESDPPGIFDEAALRAFRAGRFEPAMKDGRPVRCQAYMRMVFKLE